jgi:hypothetical protein
MGAEEILAVVLAVAAFVILFSPMLQQKVSYDKSDRKPIQRADKEFYKYANAKPFSTNVFVRKIRKYSLVSSPTFDEVIARKGKIAKHGYHLNPSIAEYTPISSSDSILETTDEGVKTIPNQNIPKEVTSFLVEDPTLVSF